MGHIPPSRKRRRPGPGLSPPGMKSGSLKVSMSGRGGKLVAIMGRGGRLCVLDERSGEIDEGEEGETLVGESFWGCARTPGSS